MSIITLNNQKLHYRLSRNDLQGHKPPLLLIHGAGGMHMHWPAELRRLPDWTVYALDLPGHGKSEGPGRDSVTGYREVVAQFCRATGLEQVVLIGHSMGGAIVQDVALHDPGRVAGLVLVGTGARLKVAPAIMDGLRADFTATAQAISEWAHGDRPPAQMKRLFLQRYLENDPATLYDDFLACDRFDLRPDLGRITAPALVICGTADRLTPPHYSELLAAKLPNARLVLISGAGHMVALEAATQVTDAVLEFVSGL